MVLPDSEGNIHSSLFLTCYVNPAPPPSPFTPHRWILPSGQAVTPTSFDDTHTAFVFPEFGDNGIVGQGLTLLVERLSYSDSGTYVCEYDDENGQTISASVDLILKGAGLYTV